MSTGLRAGVIGWPIAQSRSPLIHNYWLETLRIAGTYERAAVPPEGLSAFIRGLEGAGWRGANVTIPHKEAALAAVDEADETARAIGAVNTIWLDDGRLRGTNTDVGGFLASLDAGDPGWDGRTETALVLGAGGAARAVLYGLQRRGLAEIVVANRTPARAEALAAELGRPIRAIGFDAVPELLARTDLLVNATSLGMAGKGALEIDPGRLKSGALVTDLVYVPLETPLLRSAHAHGHRTVDGLGMLLHQAVPGFERWFGRRPTVTPALRRLVEQDVLTGA